MKARKRTRKIRCNCHSVEFQFLLFQGTTPNELKTICIEIPEQFLRPESGWAIGAMSFSSTGILLTLFVVGIFVKHSDTPVVRASGRELSYVLLSGILLCYLVTFALVLRPTDFVCGVQRFGAGFCFAVSEVFKTFTFR